MRNASKLFAGLVALTMVAAIGATARAADKPAGDKPAGKPALLHGHIKTITVDDKEKSKGTIVVAIGKGANEKDVTVTTDENTHFSIDHNPAKLEDLKEGELVAVAPMEGVAQHVDVNTTHKDKKKEGTAASEKPADAPK